MGLPLRSPVAKLSCEAATAENAKRRSFMPRTQVTGKANFSPGITSCLPVTPPIARRSRTIEGGRLRDELSRNRSQTLWNRQDCRRKFRPDMHFQADRYGKGRARIAFR